MRQPVLWLWGAVVSVAVAIAAYVWPVPFGGPMSGLGPALIMLAALCVGGGCLLAAVVSWAVTQRRKKTPHEK